MSWLKWFLNTIGLIGVTAPAAAAPFADTHPKLAGGAAVAAVLGGLAFKLSQSPLPNDRPPTP